MAVKSTSSTGIARKPESRTTSPVIAFRVPGTSRTITVALGPELEFRDQRRVIASAKPLDARGPDGGKLLTPFMRAWSRRKRKAAANVITAGIASGATTAELARAVRNDSPKEKATMKAERSVGVARRAWRKLIRESVREGICITRYEERVIEDAFLRRLHGPLKLVEVRRA